MSNLREEKLQILKMVEEGKISSQEGIDLLEALENTEESHIRNKAKWLKIRVYEGEEKPRVNLTIPMAIIDVGMRIAGKVAPNFVPELKEAGLTEKDISELLEAIKNGAIGKLVDVETDDGEKVEIIVE